jgi:hypothetical protein
MKTTLLKLVASWLGTLCLTTSPLAMAQGVPCACPEKNLLYWQAFSPGGESDLLATPIARVLGKTGINVMTRLMGLILAALAVEVMSDGLQKLFPILARA